METTAKILELTKRLEYLVKLTNHTKEYYAKLLQHNNEVPYILGQLSEDISLLDVQVKLFQSNTEKMAN